MKYSVDERRSKNVCAYIVCAGKGERTGLDYNKVLLPLGVKTALETVLDIFAEVPVDYTVVVSSASDLPIIKDIASAYKNVSVVVGGNTRTESVHNGLRAHTCDIAVIHDGARPFVTKDIILRAIASAAKFGSGIAAVPSTDTIKRIDHSGCMHAIPRAELLNVQTPQAFVYDRILDAYNRASGMFTDDAEVYESAGYSPHSVDGAYDNIKITTAADLFKVLPSGHTIGIGYDVHTLVVGRPLVLGGITVPFERGLYGHSDADVLTHAVMDALLSAAGLPDIGALFPDTDDKYLGISSMKLLDEVVTRVGDAGYDIGNLSCVIAAQAPKLSPIIKDIRANLSEALGVDMSRINISATTTEKMGVIGSGDAMAANAACILTPKPAKRHTDNRHD